MALSSQQYRYSVYLLQNARHKFWSVGGSVQVAKGRLKEDLFVLTSTEPLCAYRKFTSYSLKTRSILRSNLASPPSLADSPNYEGNRAL